MAFRIPAPYPVLIGHGDADGVVSQRWMWRIFDECGNWTHHTFSHPATGELAECQEADRLGGQCRHVAGHKGPHVFVGV